MCLGTVGSVQADCPGSPRVDLEQLLACHTLLLGAVTLEEEMRTHLGKGDISIDHRILSPPMTQGGLFQSEMEILFQRDLQCTPDTECLTAVICREGLQGGCAGCVWR